VTKVTLLSDVLPNFTKAEWVESLDYRRELIEAETSTSKVTDVNQDIAAYLRGEKPFDDLKKHDFTKAQLKDGFKQFCKLQAQQRIWLEDGTRQCFKECFAMLPNIVEATVKAHGPYQGRNNDPPIFRRIRQRILVGLDDWPNQHRYFGHLEYKGRDGLAAQAFLCLLEATGFRASFACTRNHITKLTAHAMHSGDLGFFGRTEYASLHSAARWKDVVEAFKHLEVLSLHVPDLQAGHDVVEFMRTTPEITKLLHSAVYLQNLDFRITLDHNDRWQNELPVTIPGLFSEAPKYLTHLTLSSNGKVFGHLETIIQGVSGTLTSLTLRDIFTVNLRDLLGAIRDILNLQQVYLESIDHERDSTLPYFTQFGAHQHFSRGSDIDDPFEQRVIAYLLKQREALPETGWNCDVGGQWQPSSEDEDEQDEAGEQQLEA
jgi:hypothetical protein